MYTFGTILAAMRQKAGLSQRDLAEQANLNFTYISKIERDRLPPPSADTIVILCEILQAPPYELLSVAGKLPTDVTRAVSLHENAQMFLEEAKTLDNLQWGRLLSYLRDLKP